MKLRALRLHGFKSFADRTEIVFHDGITAIVGPNGCGKSNISDAIRWVLGEQRPTAIRGAKMEEAIFQGTVRRRPVNRGSVTMEVTNEDGALPIPFREVEIARTVYRDGGSDYSLNRSACRLKDIQELCRDTGLGANAYAVIENRMIDAILSERADERRGLFEEAAGVGKYKDRRRSASLRLERAELDLQRLQDVIGEVESKVRSLARQRGKAERYRELRKRRLDLEYTLAAGQLEALGTRAAEVRKLLEGDRIQDEGLRARVIAAEGRLEALATERLRSERARADLAGRLDALRGELVRWERELAVAGEREALASRRRLQIEEERGEARFRVQSAEEGQAELDAAASRIRGELERLREEVARHAEKTTAARDRFSALRATASEVEQREREVARRVAHLQGEAEAAEARAVEMEAQSEQLERELAEAREALAETSSQGDLFQDRVAGLEAEVEKARAALDAIQSSVQEAREGLRSARQVEMSAQDRYGALSARLGGLAQMERDREGVDPPVQAVLGSPRDGVVGILADFVSSGPQLASALEAVLGVYLRAVVVRDGGVARELEDWFESQWEGGGGLILLPLDGLPPVRGEGSLLSRLTLSGEGAPWVRALLDGVDLEDAGDAPLLSAPTGSAEGSRVAADGRWVIRSGALHLGNPFGATGLLERREGLRVLREEVASAEAQAKQTRQVRETAEIRLSELEEELERSRGAIREVDEAHRSARAREAVRSDRSARLERTVEELEGHRTLTATARARARERAEEARRERARLLEEAEGLRARAASGREELDAAQGEWDEVRGRESALAVEEAKLQGEETRVRERLEAVRVGRESALTRLEALDREQGQLGEDAVRTDRIREEGEVAMARLFEERTRAEKELEVHDREFAALQDSIDAAQRAVREARTAEREAADERHGLELEAHELAGRTERLRDRLEAEWGLPFERLEDEASEVSGGEGDLRGELSEVGTALERLGPVNMLAVEEHAEESARLDFLTGQRDDLVEARNDLRDAIREINQTATRLFSDTFEEIREKFRETFLHLFEGGECDLRMTDPDDPLESEVEIHAAPRGKRTQRIDLLSGGERALTALALLFGIYLVKPSPFCVLDEIDAPLDEANIGRFIRLLQEFKARSQFVVITHNPRTIEAADWIYGVTMEEAGVSTIVGVRLDEALEVAGA